MPRHEFSSADAAKAGAMSRKGKHAKSAQWEALHESIITVHAERFNRVLVDMDDELFAKTFKDILNYFKPRIVHNINQSTAPTEIVIQNISKKYDLNPDGTKKLKQDD
jgi:hypothetical protein